MQSKITIGNWEAAWLLINAICAKVLLGFPRQTAETAGTAGWILTLYISLLALIGFTVISKLYSHFEGRDLLDIGEYIGGSIGRIIVGLTLLGFLLCIIPAVLRIFTEDMKIVSLPLSPISFVTLFFIAGMMLSAYLGIEAIARIAFIGTIFIAVAYILILLFIFPHYDVTNIFPILGNGASAIFVKGFPKISAFSELIYLFLLIPFLKTHKNFNKVGKRTILFSTFFLFIGTFSFLLTLPYPSNLERVVPIFQMTRLISFGGFFQRVESLFLISWAAAALIYVSCGFFFIVYIFKKTFKLEYHKPLIIPFAIIVFALSLLPPNLISAVQFEVLYFRNWSWLVTFGMTIILLAIGWFIKKARPQKT